MSNIGSNNNASNALRQAQQHARAERRCNTITTLHASITMIVLFRIHKKNAVICG